jgi:putative hydrolase of the HAD superfamily
MRYLLWDFDNTLAHRPGLWSQCLADLANEMCVGKSVTRELIVPHLSTGFPWQSPDRAHPLLSDPDKWWAALRPTLLDAVIKGVGVSPTQADLIVDRVRAEYTNPQHWHVYPDTRETLAELSSAGWRHIVLSNHVPELPELISALGLGSHFERVFTSAKIGFEKPHPAVFAAAVSALTPYRRIVMVGDSFVADYQGAKSAGLEAILVRGKHPNCEIAFPDLRPLPNYLKD